MDRRWRWLAALGATVALCAQAQDAGSARSELPVNAVDGGFAVATGADAGTSQLVPPALVEASPAVYPDAFLAQAVTREVVLELEVDETGAVATAEVKRGAEPAFDEEALRAAKKLRFRPAELNGVPMRVKLEFMYRFEAPRASPAAPPALLHGLVRNRANRRPLVGATVHVDGTELRAETDANGRFELPVTPGHLEITVTQPGFRAARYVEEVRDGESVELRYGLEPLVVNPYETIVEDTRDRTEVARVTLHDAELREVPGTMGDPFRVVMLLPGVSSIASGIAYPVVRGTQPAETGYFVDGVPVPILFHLFLGPSVLNADILDTLDFYPGAAPAPFGGQLGGVVDAHLKRAHDKLLHGSLSADLINSSVLLEYPFESTGTVVTLAARYSYTGWMLQTLTNLAAGPSSAVRPVLDFWDYQGRIDQRIGPGTLRLLAFGSSDTLGVAPNGNNSGGFTALTHILFHRMDLRWQQPLGAGDAEVGVTLGTDQMSLEAGAGIAGGQGSALFALNDSRIRGRGSYSVPIGRDLRLEAGLMVERRATGVDVTSDAPVNEGTTIHLELKQPIAYATNSALWMQAIWKADGWTLTPGLRVGDFRLTPGIDNFVAEPRVSVRRELGPQVTLKAGGGLYHQAPTALINLPAEDVAGLRYGLQSSLQGDVGVEWKVWRGIEVTADVYYSALLRTLEYNPLENPQLTASAFGGAGGFGGGTDPSSLGAAADAFFLSHVSHGKAYGLELMVRHPLGGNWFGWISYTLQYSDRFAHFPLYDGQGNQIGTSSGYLPFAFDQTHVLNAVLSHKFEGGWSAGATFHLNTGAPEIGGFLFSPAQTEGTDNAGNAAWVPEDLDKVPRLPFFWRVDARVAKEIVFDGFTMEAYLDLLNLTFNQEVLGYTYGVSPTDPTVLTKTPVQVPIALVTFGIKGNF